MRPWFVLVVRLLLVAVSVLLVCIATARLLLAYEIARAAGMLAKVQPVRIGDSEDSIRPLVNRFDGYRWDAQLGALEDYNYVLEINPWRFPTFTHAGSDRRDRPIGTALNARFRRTSGLRYWMVMIEISVKKHKVVAVQGDAFVEGKTKWLGASWRFSEKAREFERDPTVEYLEWPPKPDLDFVSPGILEMGTGGGTIWEFWVQPSSPAVQRQVANQWNFGCFNSLRGCNSVCDLLPEAEQFFSEHSELAPKGGGWDEDSRSCKHNESEGHYQ